MSDNNKLSAKAIVDKEKCTGCGICIDTCDQKAITVDDNDIAKIDKEKCTGCGDCVKECPSEAIILKE